MPEADNRIFGKRLLRKLSMRRQKHCYNHPQRPKRLIPGISKEISSQKRRKRTLEKLNLLIFLLLTYLVASTSCDDPYVSYDAYHIYFDTTLFSTHFRMTCCHVRRPLVWVEAYIFPQFCT